MRRIRKEEEARQQVQNIAKLNHVLALIANQEQELQALTSHLSQEEAELEHQEQQLLREKNERTLMSIEDKLSSIYTVVEAL